MLNADYPQRELQAGGVPFAFIRSSLFGVAERDDSMLRSTEIAAQPGFSVRYTGPRLNQQHAILWQAIHLLHRERGKSISQTLEITQADMLRAIGREFVSTNARRQLWERLKELQSGQVEINTHRVRFSGALLGDVRLDKVTHHYEIHLPQRLQDLIADELAHIDFDRKLSLGRNQIASWLHDFISSQSNDKYFPQPVAELLKLSGSPLGLPQFRQRLVAAAGKLRESDNALLVDFGIDDKDRFVFKKTKTRVTILPSAAKGVVEARRFRMSAEQQARMQRAHVAL